MKRDSLFRSAEQWNNLQEKELILLHKLIFSDLSSVQSYMIWTSSKLVGVDCFKLFEIRKTRGRKQIEDKYYTKYGPIRSTALPLLGMTN